MSSKIEIKDGEGQGYKAGVTSQHALKVTMVATSGVDLTPDELTRFRVFREFFNLSGSKDMNVDGSTTQQTFSIAAETGRIKYLSSIRFIMNGNNLEIDGLDAKRFGAATAVNTALTNGVECETHQGGDAIPIFATPVTKLIEFLNWADDFTNLKNSISAQSDFISFDIEFQQPIVIASGSVDNMHIHINDDLTPIDLFHCIAVGYQEVL